MSVGFKIMKDPYCEMWMSRDDNDNLLSVNYVSHTGNYELSQCTLNLNINDIDYLINDMMHHIDLLQKHRKKLLNKLIINGQEVLTNDND